jgi:integrase/recombinase XerD
MKRSTRVRISGPLMSHWKGFAEELAAQGYTDLSSANQLRLLAHLSRWMAARAIGIGQLTSYVLEQFIAERRASYTGSRTVRALAPLVQYLRSLGLIPLEAPQDVPSTELLRAYDRYLVEERAVKQQRRRVCMTAARDFLEGRDVARLSAADVTTFVGKSRAQPDLSGRLGGLRSVLGFLFLQGHTAVNLVPAVPSLSRRRLASLPKTLDGAQIAAVLATCDLRTIVGRRNYAALILMVRLGLRACEVAALTIDDIDWDLGEVVIRGKGSSGRLPLPTDVGDAVASYLKLRRRGTASRSLLLQSRAPFRDATAQMVTAIASSAIRAAGITSGGAHRLRHTAATQMLRRGASLTEIAQVLRHRHIDTTAIYAKVDHDRLRLLARPWPTCHEMSRNRLQQMARQWPGGAA